MSFRVNGGQNASSASPVTPVSSPYFAMLRDAVQAVRGGRLEGWGGG